MSAVQRLCVGLATRLRLGSHSQAALQTAARQMTSIGSGGDDSSSSDEDEQAEEPLAAAGYSGRLSQEENYEGHEGEEDEPDFDPDAQVDGQPAYEIRSGEAEGAFMMSDDLKKMWEEVQRVDPAAMLEEMERDLQESEKRELFRGFPKVL